MTAPAGTFEACRFFEKLGITFWYAVGTGIQMRTSGLGTVIEATEVLRNGKPL